jgi:hypothetical protein
MSNSNVTLQLTSFNNMQATASPVTIQAPSSGKVTLNPADANGILVKGKTHVTFVISPPTGDQNTYRPIGIAYKQTAPAQANDPLGQVNFPEVSTRNNTITIKDIFKYHGKGKDGSDPNAPQWDFSILIQRSDGTYGFIDPGIENCEEQ